MKYEYALTVGESTDTTKMGYDPQDATPYGSLKRTAKQSQKPISGITFTSDGTVFIYPADRAVKDGFDELNLNVKDFDATIDATLGANDSYGSPIRLKWDGDLNAYTTLAHESDHPRDTLGALVNGLVNHITDKLHFSITSTS